MSHDNKCKTVKYKTEKSNLSLKKALYSGHGTLCTVPIKCKLSLKDFVILFNSVTLLTQIQHTLERTR